MKPNAVLLKCMFLTGMFHLMTCPAALPYLDDLEVHSHHRMTRASSSHSSQQPVFFDVALDPLDKYHLYWTVDYDSEAITMEVKATLSSARTDWFGIGFSDRGLITDSDLCIFWVDGRRKARIQDVWTDEAGYVTTDDHNDCEVVHVQRNGRLLRLVIERKFDTCDHKDYVIEDGTTHVVYVRGKGPLRRLDGIRLTQVEHGFQRVQLLKNIQAATETFPDDTKYVDIVNRQVHVPSDDTTYWCRLHRLPEMEEKHHVIQYEANIQKGNEGLVHHMEVFHCEVSESEELPFWDAPCFLPEKPPVLEACKKVIAAWAMGALPFTYPKEAGLPIGGQNFSRYVMLEVHYNNPEKKSDWIDSSGIRLYYTKELREYDAGVMEIGLEYTDKMAIPPHQQAFALTGYCVSDCTRVGLPTEGITIFGSQLHTHLTGIRVFSKHVREGVELPEMNRDNHYSTHFQEIRRLKQSVQVMPGDALITSCWYDTTNRTEITMGGFAISDEMCVNYVHYYPKSNLEVCKSSIDTEVLASFFRYMNEYRDERTSPKKSTTENYKAIHWSQSNVDFLHHLYQTAPLSMQCNQSSGQRFQGYWNGMPTTQILSPLPGPKRKCPKQQRIEE